jgi:PAS domain S-box-containing protein
MTAEQSHIAETIVSTLLHIGGRVLEVSVDYTVTDTWERSGDEPELKEIQNFSIVTRYKGFIENCFGTGKSDIVEHSIVTGNTVATYNLRILPLHPDKRKLFIVIEFLYRKDTGEVSEDFWETALDAAGDGMWVVYIPELRISFSERWHSIFGYATDTLNTIDRWVSLIHPDDIESVQSTRTEYFEGKTRFYNSEFRLKCEDGSYKWVLSRGVIVARTPDGAPLRFTGTHTNITERKLAEEKYFSAAQLLSKLINNLRDGILVTDENKKIVYANQVFCDYYDIGLPAESVTGSDAIDGLELRKHFYLEPDRFFERSVEILDRKEIVLNEEWLMKSGRILSRDFIPLILGKNNKGAIWKFRDITAQKNTEKQLAQIRNFYEQILNYIAADIVVFDANQKYVFINPTAVKNPELRQWMIGKTDEEYCRLRNKSFDLVERRNKIFNKARDEKREIEWEEMLVNKDGETEYHLRYMYPVFDENNNHLYGIGYGLNITDRVKAQQELKTSVETFANAFNESGIGMALVSPDGRWIDVNNVLCAMTGYSKEEMLNVTFADITHPDDLDIDAPQIRKMLKKQINSYSMEKRYISRYNKIVQVLLTVSLVWNAEGHPEFYIAQVVDITGKKEMEWALNKKNAELEVTRENLLNKINQLEDLSHIIAHNLRGPASNIKMLVETMLDGQKNEEDRNPNIGPKFSDEEALILMHDASKSLLDSLGTLMQITSIKLNKEIPLDDCDVSTIVNEICNQLQSSIFEKKAVIRRVIDITTIRYPKAYLENIIYNLLSNALKYTRNGVRPEILILTQLIEGRIRITIKDNGLGIDLVRYKEKLFRLNEVFHAGFDSKGVGLYITKTQVESFGGSIEVKSTPNEGSEFTVTL